MYIKREDAIKAYNDAMTELVDGQMKEWDLGDFSECEFNTTDCKLIARKIEALPSADVVEVVRCKECKNNGKDDCPMRWWNDDWREYEMLNGEEGFCNFGEREE